MLYYGSLQCLIDLVLAALHHSAARLAVLKATGVSAGTGSLIIQSKNRE